MPCRPHSARPPRFRLAAVAALLGVFTITALSSAQTGTAIVSGRVLDANGGAPLGFASVVLEHPTTGQQLGGTLAAENGRFVIQGLPPGAYKVRISFAGFQPADTDVLVSTLNQTYDLGDIRLPRLERFKEAITVAGQTGRAEALDSQLFRLDEGPTKSTGTLLDALKNLPGVTVDQEGKVSLRGSDRVAIVIDGRQSSLTGFGSQRGLDSVSAANVEAIEIIHNPSARFDAAGMAGVINIIYKQNQQLGLSGDLGFGLGFGQFTKQRADLPTDLGSFRANEKIIPSLNLNYRTARTRTFIQSEVLFQDDLPNNEFTTRFYDDGRVIESKVPENREQYHYTVRAGTEWKATAHDTITVSGVYDFERHVDVAQVPFILQSTGQRERFWFWREEEDTGFTNVNFDWKRQLGTPGHQIGVNVQYTRGLEDEAYFLNEESRVRVGTDATHIVAAENTLPVSVDYTRPLRSGRLELGAKVQRRWIPVTYDVTRGFGSVIYQGLGDFSDWDEDIYAGYANLVRVKPSYSLEGGLRIEQTNVRYTIPSENVYYRGSDAYNYFELFPNVKFTYRLNTSDRIVAAYNRRVDRPGEPELRIFPKYDDPEILKVGNPYLRPQFTNAMEAGYGRSWNGGSLTTALYYRDITDAFTRIFAIDDSNPNYDVVNRLFENAGNSTQRGVQVSLGQTIVPAWRATADVNLFRLEVDAFETTLFFPTARPFSFAATKTNTWDVTFNNRIVLPRMPELQVNYLYYGPRAVPQGRERARSSLDIAARWPLMNERTELQFTFTDVFNDFGLRREVNGNGFRALYENLLETQVATLTLRVRF